MWYVNLFLSQCGFVSKQICKIFGLNVIYKTNFVTKQVLKHWYVNHIMWYVKHDMYSEMVVYQCGLKFGWLNYVRIIGLNMVMY